jgi:hypothetical protein
MKKKPHERRKFSPLSILRDSFLPKGPQVVVVLAIASLAVAVIFRPQAGGLAVTFFFPLSLAVFIGCLSALITTIIDRQYVLGTFTSTVAEAIDQDRSISRYGLVCAHDRLDFRELWKALEINDELCWLDTYCPLTNDFLVELKGALERHVRVKMLVIDPQCQNAAYRSVELERTTETGDSWRTGLADFTTRMQKLQRQYSPNFDLRHYDDLPGLPMYLIVRNNTPVRGYFSFFLSQGSAYLVHFELRGGDLLSEMYNYFISKWNRLGEASRQETPNTTLHQTETA